MSKLHAVLDHESRWTFCGLKLEDIGGLKFRADIENGSEIRVTSNRTLTTCLRCRKHGHPGVELVALNPTVLGALR